MNNDKIDIIIPWVDGNDPAWQAERDEWLVKLGRKVDTKVNDNNRYQIWDNLQYWFRAVEKNMPWINKIFFVTWGHLPKFLNVNHPKLKIINHKDYIPAKYLPTFNSSTIEMNFHRIEELSDNFILFNDDMFIMKPVEETYYFRNNVVCDEAIEQPIFSKYNIRPSSKWVNILKLTDMRLINKYFNKREVQAKNYDKWFSPVYGELLERNQNLSYWDNFMCFRTLHVESALKKSTLKHIWDLEPDEMDRASQNRFRSTDEYNQYLIHYWQICEGNFIPRRASGKFYASDINNVEEVVADIRQNNWKSICINEVCTPEEFVKIKSIINPVFEELSPSKSSFEK